MTFEELKIAPAIQKAILELGFESPLPVQEKVIPLLLGKTDDVVALAQTGTGKTAAYGLPLIQEAVPGSRLPQAIVLCPTRELCVQIAGDLNDYARYIDGIKILPVYGGSSIDTQIRALKNGVQIIVATPGRMIDLIERKAAKLSEVTRVVLDEADEMLNMGFLDSINEILACIPSQRNILLFSATMPDAIATIAKKYMHNALEITIGKKNSGAENIKHVCYVVHAKDKYQTLKRILDYNPGVYGIVFCRTRIDTQEIADKLIQDGYNADSLHGDLSQAQRDYVMQKFRVRNLQILVATDVAARGLDVDDLTHIINYCLPDDSEVYLHRSGRTGRVNKTGISVAIVNMKEKHLLRPIEKQIKKTFEHLTVPSGREICEKQLFHLIDKMEKVEVDHSQINSYLPLIFRKLEWLEKEDIIKRFVSLEFNRFLAYYRNAADISAPVDKPFERKNDRDDDSRTKRSRTAESGYTRLFINLGKIDNFYPNQLIELVNENTHGMKIPIGKIDLMKTYSFFEVDSRFTTELLRALKNARFNERKVIVEKASERDEDKGSHAPAKKDRPGDRNRERSGERDRGGDRNRSSDREHGGFRKDKKRKKEKKW